MGRAKNKLQFKTKNPLIIYIKGLIFFVDRLGLEPRMTESKSAVLPLHHRSIKRSAKVQIKVKNKNSIRFF